MTSGRWQEWEWEMKDLYFYLMHFCIVLNVPQIECITI